MPIHDWSRVDAGVFHDFHHAWIEQIKRLLNGDVLPPDHYAMEEKRTAHFGPDIPMHPKNLVAMRHVSGDRLVAIVEIVSLGNKSSQVAFRKLVEKAVELLSQDIHLLILDLVPPSCRDPNGIHGAIWEALTDEEYKAPAGKPLTMAAYEADMGVRAFVEAVAVGDVLPEMPVFLKAGEHVPVALESTYESAWEAVPLRWRSVIED